MPDPRRDMFAHLAETARALASASRIELLDLLVQGERSVEALAAAAQLSVANASQHLQQLHRAGLLSRRRDGRKTLYRLADDRILDLMAKLRGLTEEHVAAAERVLARHYAARDPVEPMSPEELVERLRKRTVTLVDVRPEIEFRAAHIPSAISMPVMDLADRMQDLPRRREVVAYCRGPYCVMAYRAVEVLRPVGYRARRLDGGFTEWRRAGLPLARCEG